MGPSPVTAQTNGSSDSSSSSPPSSDSPPPPSSSDSSSSSDSPPPPSSSDSSSSSSSPPPKSSPPSSETPPPPPPSQSSSSSSSSGSSNSSSPSPPSSNDDNSNSSSTNNNSNNKNDKNSSNNSNSNNNSSNSNSNDKNNDNNKNNNSSNNNSSNGNNSSNSDNGKNNNSSNKNNSNNTPSSNSPPPPRSSSSSSSKPPPSLGLSPPPPNRSSSSSRTPSHSKSSPPPSSNSSDKTPLIIGITVGVAALIIVMILIFSSCKKKKRRRPHNQMQYYDSGGHKVGHGYYNDSGQHPSWHNSPHSNEHAIKVPTPPGGGWTPPPHQHPSMMTSGDTNSNLFSGPHQAALPPPHPSLALGFNKSTFSYDELAAATNGFSQANLLGQGGFGYVHKGVMADGKIVAVKSLKTGSGQGEREFQAEVDIISRVHHRHLVSLVGYCIAGGQRMLVYEFVPNGTLEYHLHGHGRPVMDWASRIRIALGSAKGLAYLHEDCHPRIIHRDIKAANILLDDNFEAMVADFGLAKLSNDNHTHVSTRVMGTFGYLAPEYASSGKLTEKSDVFSFGIMLLELITGRLPVDTTNSYMEDSLVDWARPLLAKALEDGNYEELVDPRLENKYEPHEMAQMVACAAASIRHSGKRRPKMSQIVRALEGDYSLEDLNEGVKPGQSSTFSSSHGSGSDYEKFRKMALDSREMESGEFDNNHSTSSGDSREMNQRRMH